MSPPNPRNLEYATLLGKRDFADGIKNRTWTCRDHPGLPTGPLETQPYPCWGERDAKVEERESSVIGLPVKMEDGATAQERGCPRSWKGRKAQSF